MAERYEDLEHSETASDWEEERPEAVGMCVLSVKNIYRYTIPGFSAIQMKLQHAVVQSWSDNEDDTMDMFLRVDHALPSTDRHYPATVVVTNGCCVPVRSDVAATLIGNFSHLTDVKV